MEKINQLICYLLAVQNFAKDIHYSCHGESFYSKHIFADRIQDGLYDYIDQLKEICLLGNEIEPLPSGEYLSRATSLIPLKTDSDLNNFKSMKDLLIDSLALIEGLDNLTKGEENLIGAIAQDLQNMLGLINLQVRD